MRYRSRAALVVSLLLCAADNAYAGMPVVVLEDVARMRFQAISFFLALFLLCSWIVQRIWNSLRADLTWLPRLSYRRAVGLVSLWGLLFLLVLTMISGARELMTPGAWHKEGFTSKLHEEPAAKPEIDGSRREALNRLRIALWDYARRHDGKFPADTRVAEIPEGLWTVPDASRMSYLYEGGQLADRGDTPLAFEPDIFGGTRLVLLANGEIRPMTPGDFRRIPAPGAGR
jgi:hypothetical protein